MIVGLDVDGVLYPYHEVFTRWAERWAGLRPGTLDDTPLSWPWYKDQWGWTTEQFLACYGAGVHAGVIFTDGDPKQGALWMARQLDDAGHRIEYVSAREIPGRVEAYEAKARTQLWLLEHRFPQAKNLTITDDKASVATDIFLDDAPHNVEALRAAGHPLPVLYDLPHNYGFEWYPRALTLRSFVDMVMGMARR